MDWLRRLLSVETRERKAQPGLSAGQSLLLMLSMLVLLGAPVIVVAGLVEALDKTLNGRGFRPEVLLPMVLLIGVVALIAVLVMAVSVFRRLGLESKGSALGLPPGSIQAIIALGLILIFAIVGVYLHATSGPAERHLTGLTRTQLDNLPAGSVMSINTRGAVFDVKQAVRNEDANDFAQQMLTTISTLVVAVAGFYFGSKSVSEFTTDGRRRREDEEGDLGDGDGTGTPGGGTGGPEVDEAEQYGESPHAATVDDLEEAMDDDPIEVPDEDAHLVPAGAPGGTEKPKEDEA